MISATRAADTVNLCAQYVHAFHLRQVFCWTQALIGVERNLLAEPGCADQDRDFVCDLRDNCATVYNPWQQDVDRDGLADVCDRDIDGDGLPNTIDPAPFTPNRPNVTDRRKEVRAAANIPTPVRSFNSAASGESQFDVWV